MIHLNKYKKNMMMLKQLLIIFTITFGSMACMNDIKKENSKTLQVLNHTDTIIVKHQHKLNSSFEAGFYSKSYSYYWVVGNDTLDFVLNAREYVEDSNLAISVSHKKPILFKEVLSKIKECFVLIEEDFYLSKINSFYFKNPIYYLDLAKELSNEYEKKYGRKNISYKELNKFLLSSYLNKQLDSIVMPFNKTIQRYGIEKFHLMYKKNYGSSFSNHDFSEYPEFTINGLGLHVRLEDKKKN